MKITGERHYVDIEYDNKVARFTGELCMSGFAAIASSMKWLPPHDTLPVTKYDRISLMKAATEELRNKEFKVYFTDEQYKDIEF